MPQSTELRRRALLAHRAEGRGKKQEGRGKKEEGRGKREEGRGKREEGRRKKEEGRGKREEGRGKREEGRGKREEGRGKSSVCVCACCGEGLECARRCSLFSVGWLAAGVLDGSNGNAAVGTTARSRAGRRGNECGATTSGRNATQVVRGTVRRARLARVVWSVDRRRSRVVWRRPRVVVWRRGGGRRAAAAAAVCQRLSPPKLRMSSTPQSMPRSGSAAFAAPLSPSPAVQPHATAASALSPPPDASRSSPFTSMLGSAPNYAHAHDRHDTIRRAAVSVARSRREARYRSVASPRPPGPRGDVGCGRKRVTQTRGENAQGR